MTPGPGRGSAAGSFVAYCLRPDVQARIPALTDRVLTEQGELRRHVNVFVGEESVRWSDGLATAVPDGATITILPAVSGG